MLFRLGYDVVWSPFATVRSAVAVIAVIALIANAAAASRLHFQCLTMISLLRFIPGVVLEKLYHSPLPHRRRIASRT